MTESEDVAKALHDWHRMFMRGQMSGYARYVKSCGLSMSQASVLFQLSRQGSKCGVSDIGGRLGVTSAAASQLLDRLVHQGLIARTEDPEDRRARLVALTDRGRDIAERAMEGRRRWFTALAEAMSAAERATVVKGLKILTRKIADSDPSIASEEAEI